MATELASVHFTEVTSGPEVQASNSPERAGLGKPLTNKEDNFLISFSFGAVSVSVLRPDGLILEQRLEQNCAVEWH